MATIINGDGIVTAEGTSSTQGRLRLGEDTDNGTNYVELQAPASVASNVTFTLPSADGTSGQFLQTNGAGALTFAAAGANISRSARTSNTILSTADKGNLISITSGTFTQTFTAAATLGDGWFVYLQNAGTGDITLDPNASETIDGLTSYILYPNETRLVVCNGSAFFTTILQPGYRTFTSTGTFTVPPGISMIMVDAIGGGGGGGRQGSIGGGGGGGGGRTIAQLNPASFSIAAGASITVTIGAGGTGRTGSAGDGTNGGTSSFGSYIRVAGGSASTGNASGNPTSYGGDGGNSSVGISRWTSSSGFGDSFASGGGGGGQMFDPTYRYAGSAEWGGGGGGAGNWGSYSPPSNIAFGGSAIYGAGGGGGGWQGASAPGGQGGSSGTYTVGGGSSVGGNGSDYMVGGCGGGGGGGASSGAAGGNGGLPGGGGGGGGGSTGNGGNGGRGEVRVYWR